MKAVLLNCSLEKGTKITDTEKLLDQSAKIFQKEKIDVERIHLRDFDIKFGITSRLDSDDDWPFIFEKIVGADVIILATPIAMGDKSSLASLILERLQGYHQMKNRKGQGIFYNKVGGIIVADGEDEGSRAAAQSMHYRLSMLGFTLPPHASAVCSVSGDKNWEHVVSDVTRMTYNSLYFAELLEFHPIPVVGNRIEETKRVPRES
ncbi:NAD(P)H-dependent oxidoreductase [Halobacillus yeomjeoni]|uniref:NAD(P)H-dependent oxidoreductase n=1 Tax=Halobacillus yeomjeoni TaxID=311194 RepID=A0A931HR99_9BACI|nr:NAD(P)H-dependent oxidoreductase [Halobacillus yeomjeoni]MBH0228640.1 NAD(P)H-dependent oxidoreductase [Halobacillus yeomjeoni]MCA0983957.1 NAD(P)H-dependent oxidoreductase [Halobacillus yeomjeoni]